MDALVGRRQDVLRGTALGLGASTRWRRGVATGRIAEQYGFPVVVSDAVDPTFRFLALDGRQVRKDARPLRMRG